MFKKFLQVNNHMDEMLESKQNKAASSAYMLMVLVLLVTIFIKSVVFNLDIRYYCTDALVFLIGAGYYLYRVTVENIPIVPKRVPSFVIVVMSVLLGLSIGIKNVFFTYSENMANKPLQEQLLTMCLITIIIAVQFIILGMFGIFLINKLAKWQNDRILKKIEEESE